jgi:hypothetical protein
LSNMINPQSGVAVPMTVEPTSLVPERVTSTLGAATQATSNSVMHLNRGQRSLSMPNMNSLDKSNDEEAKRLKRLARNRASARLRRLRKKNLVESYEAEVGVLESSLAKLQAHKWGLGNNTDALLEALSMDRGQQKIDSEKRKELITSTLAQQREQVRNLLDCQLENLTLSWVAQYGVESAENSTMFSNSNDDPSTAAEVDELALELNKILELTPEQKKTT